MDAFTVALRPWGLYLAVRRPLNAGQRDEFAVLFERACLVLKDREPGWGAIADLQGAGLTDMDNDRLMGYIHLARQLGNGRAATIVANRPEADVFTAALTSAGLEGTTRILVADEVGIGVIHAAYEWVLRGVDPTPHVPAPG